MCKLDLCRRQTLMLLSPSPLSRSSSLSVYSHNVQLYSSLLFPVPSLRHSFLLVPSISHFALLLFSDSSRSQFAFPPLQRQLPTSVSSNRSPPILLQSR